MSRKHWIGLSITVVCLTTFLSVSGCSSTHPNQEPLGQTFPSVQGTSLDGTEFELPADFASQPTVAIIGYVQDAQFDCDRWLYGALQAELPIPVYEIPTIDGMIPGLISGTIDDGMRSGIPEEDWPSVVTVYDGADKIVELTGNEKPRNARVMLLDSQGRIVWFHDRGYSARVMLELEKKIESLTAVGG